jgi:hypothetical protein
MFEMVRLEVEAVPKYAVPEVVSAVVEANEMVPLVAERDPMVAVPTVAVFVKKFVDDAVVAKKDVDVACWSDVLPVAVMVPAASDPMVAVLEKSAELDAVVEKKDVEVAKVMLAKTEAKFVEVPLRVERLVDDAYVEKKRDDVAFASVTSALKVLVPVQVLLVERSEEPVERQTPLIEKQPAVMLKPLVAVEVAVPVRLRAVVWIPAAKVEVEMLVTARLVTVVVPAPSVPAKDPVPPVKDAMVAALEKRLVEEAVVVKKAVEVAFVRLAKMEKSVEDVAAPVAKRVEDAVVAKKDVEVA